MFAHLHLHTPYSFLDGGSDIEVLVRQAASLGVPALALTDHNNVSAAVKFVTLCRAYGLRPILGAEVTMEDETHLTLLARHRRGYANVCRLLTVAHTHGGRLNPHLPWGAICGAWTGTEAHPTGRGAVGTEAHPPGPSGRARRPISPAAGAVGTEAHPPDPSGRARRPIPPAAPPVEPLPLDGVICLSGCRKGLIPSSIAAGRRGRAEEVARRLRDAFGAGSFFLELQDDLTPGCDRVNRELAALADRIGVGVVATNNVHYARPEDYIAHDVLRCIAVKATFDQPHPARPLNAERCLKSETEMRARFAWRPDAVDNTGRIAEECGCGLPEDEDITPAFAVPGMGDPASTRPYRDAAGYLRHLTYKGGAARYGEMTPRTVARIEHELKVICELGYADYFLMVWDIVRWARRQGIRCTGRGSAADSCVAYCLFLTDVDVIARRLPFARFLVPGKTPDIDMDFPSERRDDVFRHIVERYGEEHVGMVCTFHTFWAKSAVRDIGKVLELPEEVLTFFSRHLNHNVRADTLDAAFDKYAELRQHGAFKERSRLLFDLCGRISAFPRHLGTHSSGIVISKVPLAEMAPLEPSARGITRIWTLDKDDAEEVGAIKFDVLSLRILSVIGDAEYGLRTSSAKPQALSEDLGLGTWGLEPRAAQPQSLSPKSQPPGPRRFDYDRIPMGDAETFRMFRAGGAVGTFQFESAAQMALAVVLQPEHFEDLVAAVALIRPGPIRGNVVQRFTACRNGWARADVLHPALRDTLAKTYGCIVFQEQVNDVVAAMTGCDDGLADRFRKSLNKRARVGKLDEARQEFVERACGFHRDLGEERANLIFDQIEGWFGYGFTEGHAASFALTGYRSAYLSVHDPAPYFAGMMNHQPMGFFSSNTLAGEARRRGVRVHPIDINASDDKCFAEDENTIRLGFRLVANIRETEIDAIRAERVRGPFRSLLDFCVRIPLHRDRLENLVLCGAFDSLHPHRRGLLWKLDETLGIALSCRAWVGAPSGSPTANHGPEAEGQTGRSRSRLGTECGEEGAPPLPSPLPRGGEGEPSASRSELREGHAEPALRGIRQVEEARADYGAGPDPSCVGMTVAADRPATPTQPHLDYGPVTDIRTPVDEEIDDFSVWDKFLWTWRITGVCAECHVFAYLRDSLSRYNVKTIYEAQQARSGARITVAGLNVRPHRPPTRSGEPILFTLIEDETGLLQTTCAGAAIENCTEVFVTSPAVVARGTIQRRGTGVTFVVERAKPLVMADFVRSADELHHAQPVEPPAMRVRVAQATQVLRG